VELNKEYRQKLKVEDPAAYQDLNRRKRYSSIKSYIRIHATDPQLKEMQQLINDKLKPWSTINTKREAAGKKEKNDN